MADGTGKVAKLVQLKLEDYFNRQRVETEFDPSGKGIHTTTPLMVQLELSYLQAAEQQWKTKTKTKKKKKKKEENKMGENKKQETKEDTRQEEGQNGREARSSSRDGERVEREGSPRAEVSPSVSRNTKIKSKVRGSEIDRITKNAQAALGQVSVNKIHSVHRYRPHLIPTEYVDLGKVAHVSHHVNAILNTEHAWECAEEYDDREAARKYVEEQNEVKRKERDDKEGLQNSAPSREKRKTTPLWLRVEMLRAQQAPESVGETQEERKTEEGEESSGRGKGEENGSQREDGTGNREGNQDEPEEDDHQGRSVETGPVEGTETEDREDGGSLGKRGGEAASEEERNDGKTASQAPGKGDGEEVESKQDSKGDKKGDCNEGRGRERGDDRSVESKHAVETHQRGVGRHHNPDSAGQRGADEETETMQGGNDAKTGGTESQGDNNALRGERPDEHGDVVDRGEASSEAGYDGQRDGAADGRNGEGASAGPGRTRTRREGGNKTEEYVRAESVVSLTDLA